MNPATLRLRSGRALERLEFPQLKELLRGRLTCAPGRRALEALAPSTDRAWIELELERVREAVWLAEQGEAPGFGGLVDPETLLAKLGVSDVILSPEELLDLATLLAAATSTRQSLGAPRFRSQLPRLRELAGDLHDFSALERNIRRRILPGGELDDHASPELAEIRAQIQKAEQKLHRALKRILGEAAAQAALQDEYVTLRGGRLVVPIRADARTRPEGVVHAASGTGHTLFLEPLETIALNNDLVRLREEEAAEIRRILRALTDQLARRRAELERAAEVIGELDSLAARARYAREFRCTLPVLHSQPGAETVLRLTAVRHPLLEEALRHTAPNLPAAGAAGPSEGGKVGATNGAVPITLELSRDRHVLVISGPNAGGKTAALKTLGLAALAAQSGIPVPAEEAHLPLFEQVLADIGDEQSLVENLSTFSAHIVNLREMAEVAHERSLVLLDELGAATSPEEGAALGIALLEHFRRRGAMTVATTHHERLKAYAAATPGVVNAAVEFDEVNLRPTYRLRVGVPGVSSGLTTAERLGLDAEIVAAARSLLTAETTETEALTRSLHQTQQALEQLQEEVRSELARLQQEREQLQRQWLNEQRKRLAELERALEATLTAFRNELRTVVESIKDPKLRVRLEKTGARQLSQAAAQAKQTFDATVLEHLQEAAAPERAAAVRRVDPAQLAPGAKVKLRGISRRGVVLAKLGEDLLEVQVGSLRMRAKVADVEEVQTQKATEPQSLRVKESKGGGTTELHVRGLRVEEALEKVDKFLDEAVLAGHTEVRIVHGIGTGALKKALTEFLASHPHVESIREAEREHGGASAMMITLRKSD